MVKLKQRQSKAERFELGEAHSSIDPFTIGAGLVGALGGFLGQKDQSDQSEAYNKIQEELARKAGLPQWSEQQLPWLFSGQGFMPEVPKYNAHAINRATEIAQGGPQLPMITDPMQFYQAAMSGDLPWLAPQDNSIPLLSNAPQFGGNVYNPEVLVDLPGKDAAQDYNRNLPQPGAAAPQLPPVQQPNPMEQVPVYDPQNPGRFLGWSTGEYNGGQSYYDPAARGYGRVNFNDYFAQ